MFAIIENGGKQYKVTKDGMIELEKIDAQPGEELIFNNILLASKDDSTHIGKPYVEGAKVIAGVVRSLKSKKTIAFKYRRRKSSKTKKGHRQQLTLVKIKDIRL